MLTAIEENTAIGDLLISRGAALDKTNNFGETALSLADHGGHASFIRLLIDNGASADCRPHSHSLKDWVSEASGLPQDRLASVLELLADAGAK